MDIKNYSKTLMRNDLLIHSKLITFENSKITVFLIWVKKILLPYNLFVGYGLECG